MSLSAATIDALVAAGVTAEQLAAAIKAELAAADAVKAERRAKDAERKRRSRASEMSRDVTRTNAESAGHGVTDADPSLDKESSPQTPLKEIKPTRECISTRARGDLDGFERFWEACPRKTAKGAAKAAWPKALAKVSGPDPPGVLIAAMRRAAEGWRDEDPNFIPHPATWLNQERWTDEPISPRNERPANEFRPLDPSRQAPPADARRANTEARRSAWLELAAERDGLGPEPEHGRGGPARDRGGGDGGYQLLPASDHDGDRYRA